MKTKINIICDRLKSFKDCCEDLNIKTHGDAFKLLNLKRSLLSDVAIEYCDDVSLRLMIWAYALNEGHIFDWNIENEYKYFPYFDMRKKPGSGFYSSGYYDWLTNSCVSSRLACKSTKLAIHFAKQAEQDWYEYMTQK